MAASCLCVCLGVAALLWNKTVCPASCHHPLQHFPALLSHTHTFPTLYLLDIFSLLSSLFALRTPQSVIVSASQHLLAHCSVFSILEAQMATVVTTTGTTANPPCCPVIPTCVQCGTYRNPCHCRVVGPTLGVVAFAVAAAIEWPLGAFVWCFRHYKGRRIMAHPAAVVYPRVASCLPI